MMRNTEKNQRCRNTVSVLLATIVTLLASSCIPQKQIVLVQDAIPNEKVYNPSNSITEKYVLQPNDYIYVNVLSPNIELSAFFNPQTALGSSSGNSIRKEFFYYGLDDSSRIDFPNVGIIDLKGCTVKEAKERIRKEVAKSLKDFNLIVRLATNKFSIIGEVTKQGEYTMERDQITVFDAIATAGGFTTFAKRKEVKLLRKNADGQMEVHELDLTQGDSFIESEFYYIYPNDVLYVRPTWHKMFGWGETFSVSLISSILSMCILVLTIKNK